MIIALLSSTFWLRGEFKPFSFFKLFVFSYILGYTCIQNSFHNFGGPRFSNHNLLNSHDLFFEAGAPMLGRKRLSGFVFINILAYIGNSQISRGRLAKRSFVSRSGRGLPATSPRLSMPNGGVMPPLCPFCHPLR